MFKGLVALITGAASGLGKCTAEELVRKGASVIICDLPSSEGANVAKRIGNGTIFSGCDVALEADVLNSLDICKSTFGKLDIAINCAAMHRAFKIYNERSDKMTELVEMETVLSSNLYGSFNVSRLCAQLMAENEPDKDGQRGLIIHTSCLSAKDGIVGQVIMAAAKAGTESMVLPMSRDLSSLGIRVMCIAPGLINSPLTSELCLTTKIIEFLEFQSLSPKRFGFPEEYYQVVEEIITNKQLNGATIGVNAGLRLFSDCKSQ